MKVGPVAICHPLGQLVFLGRNSIRCDLMARKLATKSIQELEFLSQDKSQLPQVIDELQFRHTRRAKALVAKLKSHSSFVQSETKINKNGTFGELGLVQAARHLLSDLQESDGIPTETLRSRLQSELSAFEAGQLSPEDFLSSYVQVKIDQSGTSGFPSSQVGNLGFDHRRALERVNSEHTLPTTWLEHIGTKPPPQPHPLWGLSALARTAHMDPKAISSVFDGVQFENEVVRSIAYLVKGGFSDWVCESFVPGDFDAHGVLLRAKRLSVTMTSR